MDTIRLGEHIAGLRRDRKITQEQLAEFMGVTKASVSKWETRQSMPDVILLPRLAAFFDITIDELLGYEPQLSKEQIQKLYGNLAQSFATEEFEMTTQKCRALVKQYYSCYEFLYQMVILWLNHYMLAGDVRGMELLKEAEALCSHILEHCKDIALCAEVVMLKSLVCLQLGKTKEVIEELEDIINPDRMTSTGEGVLISAYMCEGEMKKAHSFAQISMFKHLMSLVESATMYMTMHRDNLALCEETFRRIKGMTELFSLEALNFNSVALAYYEMAIDYSLHNRKSEAIEHLKKFISLTDGFLSGDAGLWQEDEYFDSLEELLEQQILGSNLPRDKRVIYDSMMSVFDTPELEGLKTEEEFLKLKDFAAKRGTEYEE